MSTHWDIVCVEEGCQHGSFAGFHANRMVEELREIMRNMPQLAAAKGALATLDEHTDLTWRLHGDGPNLKELGAWAYDHKNCKLQLRNEYGQYDDQCTEYTRCLNCGSNKPCKKPLRHEGPCNPRDDGEVGVVSSATYMTVRDERDALRAQLINFADACRTRKVGEGWPALQPLIDKYGSKP